MAYEIEDIDWSKMPEGAVEFMLETTGEYLTWVLDDNTYRYYNRYDKNWIIEETWRDSDKRTRYKVSDYHPEQKVWNGEGFPSVGTVCALVEETEFLATHSGKVTIKPKGEKVAVIGHATRLDNHAVCVTLQPVDDMECGYSTINPDFVEPIKSNKDKFVEQLLNYYHKLKWIAPSPEEAGVIYDAIVSGEVEVRE